MILPMFVKLSPQISVPRWRRRSELTYILDAIIMNYLGRLVYRYLVFSHIFSTIILPFNSATLTVRKYLLDESNSASISKFSANGVYIEYQDGPSYI